MNKDVILIFGSFLQPAEIVCALFGMEGANLRGTHEFLGVLKRETEELPWQGQMKDIYGLSELSEVTYTKNSFCFTKRYTNGRKDHIKYVCSWDKQNHWWEGTWKIFEGADEIDRGEVKLYLIPSSLEFFQFSEKK